MNEDRRQHGLLFGGVRRISDGQSRVVYEPQPLPPERLAPWLERTVAEAYHSTNGHHTFEECGDPFCQDAKMYLRQILDVLHAVYPAGEESPA